jgi:ketosteroid isomerase-like protein
VSATTTATDLEAVVAAFDAKWRAGGPAAAFVERWRDLLDPEIRLVQPQVPTLVGFEAFARGFVGPFFALMPDARGEVLGWAAAGDTAYVEIEITGTIGRRQVKLRSCDRLTVRDGRIVERVAYADPGPLLGAIALTPRAWPTFIRMQIDQRRR